MRFGPCLSKETEKILITAYSISVFWDKKGSRTQLAVFSVGNSHSLARVCRVMKSTPTFLSESINYTRLSRFKSLLTLYGSFFQTPKPPLQKAKTDICEKKVCKEKPCLDCDQLRHTHQKQGLNSLI